MMTQTPKTQKTTLLISAIFLLACLFTAGAASAIPTCETDCNANTPCDQVCRLQGCQTQYSTCAMFICDEPQFPWPPFAVGAFGDSLLSPELQADEVVADGSESEATVNEQASEPAAAEAVAAD